MSEERFTRYSGLTVLRVDEAEAFTPEDFLMSDPKWPNEPFTARHDASGTPVKVTPVDTGEPELLPQSMRIGKGAAQELHWTDIEEQKLAGVVAKLKGRGHDLGIWSNGSVITRSFELDFAVALLAVIDRLEARIAQLETPPSEGT